MVVRARLLLLLTLVGLGATLASTWVHYELLHDPALSSACDVNATLSCTDAYRSVYATLAGVPVALLGACFFAGLLVLQVGSRVFGVPHPEHVPTYLLVSTVPALVFAGYLAWASWFVLRVLCLLCLTTDVALLGLVVVAASSTRFPMHMLTRRFLVDARALLARPVALALAALFLASVALVLGWFPRDMVGSSLSAETVVPDDLALPAAPVEPSLPQASQLEAFLDSQPRRMIPVDAAGAQVVIVKFNDYQCPPCGQTYQAYKPLKAKWDKQAPGKVKFVTKDFPLETECNATIQRGLHPLACEAAAAVRMARRNNKAEPLEDWLFANQQTLTAEGLRKAVRDIGGVADFDAQYPRVLNDVKIDTSLGGFLGVGSTPTFFVNGVQMPDNRTQVMDAAIAYELQKASRK
jgi:uncharacterized membrane protein/protein-disulfide isomerase